MNSVAGAARHCLHLWHQPLSASRVRYFSAFGRAATRRRTFEDASRAPGQPVAGRIATGHGRFKGATGGPSFPPEIIGKCDAFAARSQGAPGGFAATLHWRLQVRAEVVSDLTSYT
jgi:hypothetical protein